MSQKEQREVEKGHLQTPTIGRYFHLDDKALRALFNSYVYRARLEVEDLDSMFNPKATGHTIDTYTQLDDAASLIEITIEELLDLSVLMRHLSREMEGRDRIDG